MRTTMKAAIVLAGMLALLAPVAPATASIAAPQSVTVATQTTVTAKTPACVKATKAVTKAKKTLTAAKKTGSSKKVAKAKKALTAAKKTMAKKCAVVSLPPKTTLSGDPRDPRPTTWTRPADGSGELGSNMPGLIVPAGCPVTIPEVRKWSTVLDSGTPVWVIGVTVVNYSSETWRVAVEVDATTAGGMNFDYIPEINFPGDPNVISTTLTMGPYVDNGGIGYTAMRVDRLDGTPETVKILRAEITECTRVTN